MFWGVHICKDPSSFGDDTQAEYGVLSQASTEQHIACRFAAGSQSKLLRAAFVTPERPTCFRCTRSGGCGSHGHMGSCGRRLGGMLQRCCNPARCQACCTVRLRRQPSGCNCWSSPSGHNRPVQKTQSLERPVNTMKPRLDCGKVQSPTHKGQSGTTPLPQLAAKLHHDITAEVISNSMCALQHSLPLSIRGSAQVSQDVVQQVIRVLAIHLLCPKSFSCRFSRVRCEALKCTYLVCSGSHNRI